MQTDQPQLEDHKTVDMNNNDHLAAAEYSAGKPWVLPFMWMLLDTIHPPQTSTQIKHQHTLMGLVPQEEDVCYYITKTARRTSRCLRSKWDVPVHGWGRDQIHDRVLWLKEHPHEHQDFPTMHYSARCSGAMIVDVHFTCEWFECCGRVLFVVCFNHFVLDQLLSYFKKNTRFSKKGHLESYKGGNIWINVM